MLCIQCILPFLRAIFPRHRCLHWGMNIYSGLKIKAGQQTRYGVFIFAVLTGQTFNLLVILTSQISSHWKIPKFLCYSVVYYIPITDFLRLHNCGNASWNELELFFPNHTTKHSLSPSSIALVSIGKLKHEAAQNKTKLFNSMHSTRETMGCLWQEDNFYYQLQW